MVEKTRALSPALSATSRQAHTPIFLQTLCFLLSLVLIVGFCPVSASAEEAEGFSEEDIYIESEEMEDIQEAVGESAFISEEETGAYAQSDEFTPMASTITIPVQGQYRQDYARSILSVVNQHRAEMGVAAIKWDSTMEQAAKTRAAELAVSYYPAHERPDGTTCFTAWSWSGMAAENIAMGQTSPEAVMKAWYDNEKVNYDTNNGGQTGHYLNIINSNAHSIGIACFESNGKLFWVQDFNGATGSGMSGSADTSSVVKNITATPDKAALTMSSSSLSIYIGEPYVMGGSNLRIKYSSGGLVPLTNSAMSYNSSSTSVMTVSKTSSAVTLTGKAIGTSTLTGWLTSNSASKATATIKVMGKLDNTAYCSVSNIPNQIYTGSYITPSVTVKFNNSTLVKDTDYTVSYSNNRYEGTATARITGKGNYTGTISKTFEISKPSLADATIASIPAKTYTGSAINISSSSMPSITLAGKTLTYNTDYTVSYANNINAGTATVTFTGRGNYGGTATKTFVINPALLQSAAFSMPAKPLYYTGSAVQPLPSLSFAGKVLSSGTDYTLSYANNVNAGTGTVYVTGKGNFSGIRSSNFTINRTSLSNATVALASSVEYTGSPITPTVSVSVDGRTLLAGTDYDISFSDNTYKGTAKATIVGKGNYTGSTSKTFSIVSVNVANATLTLPSGYTYSGSPITPIPFVTYSGKTLVQGTDYELTYYNNVNAGSATVFVKGLGNFTGSKPQTFAINKKNIATTSIADIPKQVHDGSAKTPSVTVTDGSKVLVQDKDYTLSYANNTNKGTASVVVAGMGNYQGSTTSSFEIIDAINIASAQISLSASPAYTGKAQTPKPTVSFGGLPLAEGVDYRLNWVNNVNAGTANVVVYGMGLFASAAEISFTIKKASLNVKTESASKSYDGTPLVAGASLIGLVNGEIATVHTTGSQVDVGSSPNDFYIDWDTANKDNYAITISKGVLTVFEPTEPNRLAGEDSSKTAAAISKEAYPEGSEWVILARNDDFADAMSATGLAGTLNAPIILTDRKQLSASAADEITRLGAKKCYIIGGTGAMPGDFEGQLKALGMTKAERVNGSESWDTSVACANKIAAHNGNANGDAIVVMSSNFQDALSISSFAYKYGVPIYLETSMDQGRILPDGAKNAILNLKGTIYVAGGSGAVPTGSVEDTFDNHKVVRIAGTDGYDTSNQIATYMVKNNLLSAQMACIACGANAAKGSDALAGAALAGKNGGVMLLVNSNTAMEPERLVTIEGRDSLNTDAFLTKHVSSVRDIYILGGKYVVSENLENKIDSLL